MPFERPTRRTILLSSLASPAIARAQPAAANALTVSAVIDRIKANAGATVRPATVDKLLAGKPDLPVRGIAATMMATLAVLRRAADQNMNLVITHETPFYMHQDGIEDLKDDATLQFKLDFIRDRGLAIFHFHDQWHDRKPDGIATGMARELGWSAYSAAQEPRRFHFASALPLAALARHMQSRLGARTMRITGDPKLPIHHAFASWGYAGRMPPISLFRETGVDLFICGETREWELVEYVQDAIASGQKKALIVLGHVASEQAGMKYCAEWLKSLVPEAPVAFIPVAEPFWRLGG